MADELWLLFEADGRYHQVHAPKGKKPHNPEGFKAVKVDRHTLDPGCETYDRKARKWVLDAEKRARIDEEMRLLTMTGPQVYAELAPVIADLERRLRAVETAARSLEVRQ